MQKNKYILVLVLICLLSTNIFALPEINNEDLDSYVLMDRTSGHILIEKGKDQPVNVEGVTNILTSIIAVEKGDLTKKVSIGENPVKVMGTKVYLQEKEKIVLAELIKAALIYSANDAALAIAENISGSDVKFVEELNLKAAEIGCINTVLTNSYGQKDSRHFTTAYDLALMARYAMENETFATYAKIKSFNWSGASWQALITNRNILLEEYSGVTGIMVGTRGDQDKVDLVLSYQTEENDYILVMTNASIDKVFEQAVSLIQYTKENYQIVRIVDAGDSIITVNSLDGEVINGLSAKAVSVPIRAGVKIDASKEFYMNEIERPLKEGDKIGEVVYFVGGEELERVDVLSDKNLSRRIGYINMAIYAFALLYLIQIIYRIMKMKRKSKRR